MNTAEFIENIGSKLSRPLYFGIDGISTPNNHHISEVKQLEITSTDCGGKQHSWSETIFHLFVPDTDSKTQMRPDMTVEKLSQILDRAETLNIASEIKIEYSENKKSAISSYRIADSSIKDDKVFIHLSPHLSECKPLANIDQGACCNG